MASQRPERRYEIGFARVGTLPHVRSEQTENRKENGLAPACTREWEGQGVGLARRVSKLLLLAGALMAGAVSSVGLATSAAAAPPPNNPGFETVGSSGPATVNSTAAPGGAGMSAAADWGVFHNSAPSTTVTRLVNPSSAPGGGTHMLYVRTDAPLNGLAQMWAPFNTGPTSVTASGWVYVVNGTVGMGTGNGGNTSIDATSTTTGAWEYLQAPNGQSPVNEMIFYAVGGPAEFFVDLADIVPSQKIGERVPIEYSNDLDERSIPGGGNHGRHDPGQVLYTEPIDSPAADSNPIDAIDFFPGIEGGTEPDAQVDALANGNDAGFDAVVNRDADLLFSLEFDPGHSEPVALFREVGPSGAVGVHYTQRWLNALDGPGHLEDVDAVELWGPEGADSADADFLSLQADVGGGSVYYAGSGVLKTYLTPAQIAAAIQPLGFHGQAAQVDVDALMVKDVQVAGFWDAGDEVLFSVRAAGGWDGGEIVHWRYGQPAAFLAHGGHLWNTAFSISGATGVHGEEVDAIEARPVDAPICGLVGLEAFLFLPLLLRRFRR